MLEIVINEVSSQKQDPYRVTAEHIVTKLLSDPSSVAIMTHLLGKIGRVELERLLTNVAPKAHFEAAKSAESEAGETLDRLERCYRMAFDLAPADLKRTVAEAVHRHSGERERVRRSVLREQILPRFRPGVPGGGGARHREDALLRQPGEEGHPRAGQRGGGDGRFPDYGAGRPRVLRAAGAEPARGERRKLYAGVLPPVVEESRLLADEQRRNLLGWVGRLRWSLQQDGRTSAAEAIARLESLLGVAAVRRLILKTLLRYHRFIEIRAGLVYLCR